MRATSTRARTLPFLALACAATIGTPAHAGPAEPDDPGFDSASDPGSSSSSSTGPGLRTPRGYLNIAPGVVNFNLTDAGDGVYPTYLWGLDGGYHLPIGPVFALQAGGFFEHVARPGFQRFRLGPQIRLGGGNDRVYGYGLIRLGVEVDTFATGFGRFTGAGFHSAFGGGVMGMVHRIVSLGGEAYIDVLSTNGAAVFMNLRFMVGIWF